MFGKMLKKFKREKYINENGLNEINKNIHTKKNDVQNQQMDEMMTNLLMSKLEVFRKDTKELDYLRDEIEDIITNQPDGEEKSIQALAEAFKK